MSLLCKGHAAILSRVEQITFGSGRMVFFGPSQGEGNLGEDCSGLLSGAGTGQFIQDETIIGRDHT